MDAMDQFKYIIDTDTCKYDVMSVTGECSTLQRAKIFVTTGCQTLSI